MSFQSIESAFAVKGLKIVNEECFHKEEHFIYAVDRSSSLPKRSVAEIICSAKYFPIISEQRLDGNIIFTVCPYRKGRIFDMPPCATKEITKETLWDEIIKTRSLLRPGEPIIVQGKTIHQDASEFWKKHLLPRYALNPQACCLMTEFIDLAPSMGRVLDMGCGVGINSIPLLSKGWQVWAVDNDLEALEWYKSSALKVKSTCLERGQLHLLHSDILTCTLPGKSFDALICVDVLPYIESTKLKSLMDKIHALLVPNGCFVGSLMFEKETTSPLHEYLRKVGVHFYAGEYIVPALLKYSGFHIEECFQRLSSRAKHGVVQFRVRKMAN